MVLHLATKGAAYLLMKESAWAQRWRLKPHFFDEGEFVLFDVEAEDALGCGSSSWTLLVGAQTVTEITHDGGWQLL
eukprot:6366213-Prorocentrum_lima.AAC.1